MRPAAAGHRLLTPRVRRTAALLAASVALVAAGCGSEDGENAAETTTAPALTAPAATPTTPARPPTRDDPATAPNGGQDVPPGGNSGGTPAPAPEDSPENDTPPEPGSAADRFEEQCRRTPAACD